MKMRSLFVAFTLAAIASNCSPAHAASVRVAPISLDLRNGANASSVRVWNDDRDPLNVQVRIFRWIVRDGKDVLEPTQDVVVSPPMMVLRPGSENTIRIVRLKKQPVAGRESYRLIIDQLPDRSKRHPGTVNVLVRHAIPVYFE